MASVWRSGQVAAHVRAALQPAVLAIVAGLFAGLALSVGLNTVVARWSIGNLEDPVVLVAISLVLFVATIMAAALPANRERLRFSRQTRFGPTEQRPSAPIEEFPRPDFRQ